MSTGNHRQLLIAAAVGVASLTVLLFALRRRNRRRLPSFSHSTQSSQSNQVAETRSEKDSEPIAEPQIAKPLSSSALDKSEDQSVSFLNVFCTLLMLSRQITLSFSSLFNHYHFFFNMAID